ncbi:Peroxisomal membrane protein 11B [Operophtera brumata]|uniref:Peroxisomal membrane protein 11B n=1 Tax=Operophtera brumata TaxID=104452 RepID=A0A0L7KTL3_OPEBR|nr:Peroxisomal membrane protein 11B [Operophtera brumata]
MDVIIKVNNQSNGRDKLARCIDIFYTALNTINIEDPFLKCTLTVSKLAHALYLYADHVVWLTRSGFLKTDSDSWNKTANKFWLLSIIANLARDFYEILHLLELHSKKFLKPSELVNASINIDYSSSFKHIYAVVSCHKDVFIDTMKNSCDLFIPLTALGLTKLSPSAVGALGAISSLAAIVTVVKPITKLVPA